MIRYKWKSLVTSETTDSGKLEHCCVHTQLTYRTLHVPDKHAWHSQSVLGSPAYAEVEQEATVSCHLFSGRKGEDRIWGHYYLRLNMNKSPPPRMPMFWIIGLQLIGACENFKRWGQAGRNKCVGGILSVAVSCLSIYFLFGYELKSCPVPHVLLTMTVGPSTKER